ncbi:hypothetical protein [Mycobacterium gallinarum]|uniref:hypothetical protein n=1 Tax=Mycobacterium gallinarum TaxID=39689 RepID=UPI0013D85390|nr:hypothetical protein [Mycobacterium gallinarum]
MSDPTQNKPDAHERQRALSAVELRVQGQAYAQIAHALGYSDESGARHAVSRLLARREAEGIDELRAVHLARLEGVLSAFWPAATSGDTDAARIVLRTLDSLAKLYGLDAPTRVAVGASLTDTVGFANEAARLIESIASMGGTDDLLLSLPDGAGHAVIAAREPAALTEAVAVADDDAESWSNIGGPDPEPLAAEPESDAEPEPLTVVEIEPPPVAEVEQVAEPDVTPLPSPPSPRVDPWARRVTYRYDPLAGWRR